MTWLRRLLCAVGLHRWEWEPVLSDGWVLCGQCRWCGKADYER